MNRQFEAKALTDERGNTIGFTDHTGYFYPVDRGQLRPGVFHCDVPLSSLEIGELVLRLDQLCREARSFNRTLDLNVSPSFRELCDRVRTVELLIASAASALSGDTEEDGD